MDLKYTLEKLRAGVETLTEQKNTVEALSDAWVSQLMTLNKSDFPYYLESAWITVEKSIIVYIPTDTQKENLRVNILKMPEEKCKNTINQIVALTSLIENELKKSKMSE